MRNYKSKLKQHFKFSREERLSFIVTVIVLTLIYTWDKWGVDKFDANVGLQNFLFALIIMAITVFIHHSGQRMAALYLGFRAEQKLWWYGPLIGLMLVILSYGKLKFLAATGTMMYLLPAHRIGAFRYGPNMTTIAKIAAAGPFANIAFGVLVKIIEWIGILPATISQPIFDLNILYAAWNLLPIPPLDGSKVIYYSRMTYAFMFGAVGSYMLLAHLLNFYSISVALLMGVLFWIVYYIKFEK
jgi:Zn-dependent protease